MTALRSVAILADEPVHNYRGDVSPSEAWRVLADEASSMLIDVRTDAEWNYVGVPDLSSLGKEPILACWQFFPGNKKNEHFVEDVSGRVPDHNTTLLFLCRSGGRSKAAAAAMTQSGYARCFNVSGGFEGDCDSQKHRSSIGGWKVATLPWTQK